MRYRRPILSYPVRWVSSLLLFLMLTAGVGRAEGPRLNIWCEFLPYHRVRAWLPVLARYECGLILHVKRENVGDPALAALLREARERRVPVSAWLLLPVDEHIYVGEATIEAFERFSTRFLDWAQSARLDAEWLVFDCEPSFLLGKRLVEQVRKRNLRGVARVLKKEKNPAQFEATAGRLNALVAQLRTRDARIMGSANRAFLDAQRYGNITVQDTLGVPFTMVDWDRGSFITYRYQVSHGRYLAMMHHYAALAHRFYGDRAALDVGLLGDHRRVVGHRKRAQASGSEKYYLSFLDGIRSPEELTEAIAVGMSRGVNRYNLFSLDGAVESAAGLEDWLAAAAQARPEQGWQLLTRLRSARLTLTMWFADQLFNLFVGREEYDLAE